MTKPDHLESRGFAEKSAELLCKCRTFALDRRARSYLDGQDFVHTVISCPPTALSGEVIKLERAVIEASVSLFGIGGVGDMEWDRENAMVYSKLESATLTLLKARGTQ